MMARVRGRRGAADGTVVEDGLAERPELSRAPVLPAPRRRRRPGLLALSLLLVVLGGLAATVLASSLGSAVPVIAVAESVAAGETIEATDLVAAQMAADPALAPIPYADLDEVVGLTAAVDLPAGSLLTREAVTAERFPPAGLYLVGVAVSRAQLPASPLRPGDAVLLVPMADPAGAPDGAADPPAGGGSAEGVAAEVARVGESDVNGQRVVDVLVDAADGPSLAARAAAGLVVIVVVPAGD